MANPTSMPDFIPDSDSDETLEPHFNDTGDFGDSHDDLFNQGDLDDQD